MNKMQIRRGVFETNSSSTHSLQITGKNQDTVYSEILSSIAERYGKDSGLFDPSDYLCDGCLRISGFNIPDGDEEGDVYVIIKSPMAKIQYLGMFLDYTNENHVSVPPKIVAEFKHIAYDYLNSLGFDVKYIAIDIEHSSHWTEYFYSEDSSLDYDDFYNMFKDIEKFREFVKDILYNDKLLVYKDTAYSPYIKPEILIV